MTFYPMSILKTYEAAAFGLTHMLLTHTFLLPNLKQAANTQIAYPQLNTCSPYLNACSPTLFDKHKETLAKLVSTQCNQGFLCNTH